MIDNDRTAGRQVHIAAVGSLNLVLDLKTRKQRHVIAIKFHLIDVVRHHVGHELLRLLVQRFRVDQNLADVGLEQVTDRANYQAAFLINQERAFLAGGRIFDGSPQLHEVV